MSSSDRPDHDSSPDSAPALSQDAVTPRGGFMARPGLKAAPRHAVVVRLGDAPESDDIPLARASAPPPPPSEPAPLSASEKLTLRAVPTRSSPVPPSVMPVSPALHEAARPSALESAPPPSDAPLVASVRGADSSAPSSRQPHARSRWTIVLAAAAGLLLGLASVASRARAPRAAAAPAAPSVVVIADVHRAVAPASPSASTQSPGDPPRVEPDAARPPAVARPTSLGAKRSIF